uniref:Uncharacterized protein n=1 Tax=Arundo donax TaxID=35708 RepID=A0A0A9CFI5_ARUDO
MESYLYEKDRHLGNWHSISWIFV